MLRYVLMACVLALNAVFAAADIDNRNSTRSYDTIAVTTSAVKTINLPNSYCTIIHRSLKDDGTTASAATDHIVIMNAADTMVASTAAGKKLDLVAGSSGTIDGRTVPQSSTLGPRCIQIQAVGNGATVMIIYGGG